MSKPKVKETKIVKLPEIDFKEAIDRIEEGFNYIIPQLDIDDIEISGRKFIDSGDGVYSIDVGIYDIYFLTCDNKGEDCLCEWCHEDYDFSKNFGEPEYKHVVDYNILYITVGYHCSPECLLAHTIEQNNKTLKRKVNEMLGRCYPDDEIEAAPHRRMHKNFKGSFSSRKFREHRKSDFLTPQVDRSQARIIYQMNL